MPKQITQYRVFIGSPGGLEEERECFRRKLEKFTEMHSEPRNVAFRSVGWEETTSGAGRPQELINEDLKQCDYALFVLHDRWGSPTGSGYTSGVEEEWALAEALYKATKIRNIALFFKKVDPRQLRDPGPQLASVLTFKKRIEEEKRYLFRQYGSIDQFADGLETHLTRWLRDHERTVVDFSASGPISSEASATSMRVSSPPVVAPNFGYWIEEATRLLEQDSPDHNAALFCATKSIAAAESDIEWARGTFVAGITQFYLGKADEAITAFTRTAERFSGSIDLERRYEWAKALFNKGVTLGELGRNEDAIGAYDDVLVKFGTATELPLREQVASALLNKGNALGRLGHSKHAVAVSDDLLNRFGKATELPLRERVASALFNKGIMLSVLGRSKDEIAAYNVLLARFGTATELPLRKHVANALINKAVTLRRLGRSEEEICVYDDLLASFGTATELPLREQVARALFNKAVTLRRLGRSEDTIAVYDDLLARFDTATELSLRTQVGHALLNKGFTLRVLSRSEDAIAACDNLLARFGTATEPPLRQLAAIAASRKIDLRKS